MIRNGDSNKKVLCLDIGGNSSPMELQCQLQSELRLSSYYGKNWDSFWDCLTDGSVFNGRNLLNLKLVGIGQYEKKQPRDAGILRKIVDEYNSSKYSGIAGDGRDNVVNINTSVNVASGTRKIILYEKRPCVYFTRHGQTIWNVENKICGATDIALTKLGEQQAEELGSKLSEDNHGIDEILYSPLVRASETALRISQLSKIPRRCEFRLKEQNFGRFESTPRDGAEFQDAKRHFIDSYDGGETMLSLAQRIYNLLDDIKRESSDKTYLLVAHNGIARVVRSYFHDMSNEEFASYGMKNCELVRYDFDI
jgi:probable phosphoglycerate mutase